MHDEEAYERGYKYSKSLAESSRREYLAGMPPEVIVTAMTATLCQWLSFIPKDQADQILKTLSYGADVGRSVIECPCPDTMDDAIEAFRAYSRSNHKE